MFRRLSTLLGVLLFMLLSVTLGSAGSLDARNPQDDDDDASTTLHFYTPTPSLTIPSWYTATSSASQPTGSVSFAFGYIGDTSVCGESTITWSYTGDTSYMMGIAAMPIAVENSGSSDDLPTVLAVLNGGLGIDQYVWSPVNVTEGEYVMEVSIPNVGLLFFSEPFYVNNSSDHTCLSGSSSQTSGMPSIATSTSASPSPTNSSAQGDASGAPVVGAVNGNSSMSGGGIAGVVIGVLAFVASLIIVLIFYRRWRSSKISGAPRGGLFEKRRPKGAISISSRTGSFSSTFGQPRREFGMARHYSLNDRSQSALGHGNSDENGPPLISWEKPLDITPFEIGMIPPVVHRSSHAYRDSLGSLGSGSTTIGSPGGLTHHSRPSRHSSLLYTSDPFSSHPPTPSPRASEDYHLQSGAHRQSQVPVALFSPPSTTSTPRTYGSPGVPRDISIASSSSPDLAYETDTTSPSVGDSRRAAPAPPVAAPSAQPARRSKSASARKPVPTYEPSVSGEALELVEPATPHSTSGTGTSYYNSSTAQQSKVSLGASSAGNDWSSAAAHSHSAATGTSPTGSGTYLSHASGQSLSSFTGRGDMPELNHKSSFGERQLHVLIPDPPTQEMQ